MSRPPLRRTRRDLIATAALAVLGIAAVTGVALTSPIRSAHPNPYAGEYSAPPSLDAVPAAFVEEWEAPDVPTPGVNRPLYAYGLTFSRDDHTVYARDHRGEVLWSYGRDDHEICSLGTAWGSVVITYRNGGGCGDAVALDAKTGEYEHTRSALNSADTAAVASNDRIGTVSPERVELWRSDLVRTVEYGDVEAKQEPELQPHEECSITSALTRKDVLAVTEVCPGEEGTWLRMQEATPESSREPEITGEVLLPEEGVRLVSVGESAAAVYIPGQRPRIASFDTAGVELASREVEPSPLIEEAPAEEIFSPRTADLPSRMSWFDGQRLYLFHPNDLSVSQVIEDAIGTGAALAERLLYPTAAGIAIADAEGTHTERTVEVARPQEASVIALAVVGDTVVERRDGNLVGLRATP
ncbi:MULTISPECIES: hypothetical protein [unclassified Corynebacterium]|uniref:Rv3212 family protein n=1 Tax=unclassified Corynebacterium TaxID=2624378 RepID=UPI0029CA57FA|nr:MULTISPECIES: hypothetical protein [unclassified Corynebacterium]WPF66657.1 hypothetical protein OLX12_02680 [Corynebacterium sp. 22KM0430]WPF69145.1 hypothetical protein OLW90_02675 [Corynebacterium sp. 21KM1197]